MKRRTPTKRMQAPLRKIIKEGMEPVDVGLEHPIELWIETLECTHKVRPRNDHMGKTNAYRRRCVQCLKEGKTGPLPV